MPKEVTMPLIKDVVNDVEKGRFYVARRKIMALPKQEAITCTAYVMSYLQNHPKTEKFLDALLYP